MNVIQPKGPSFLSNSTPSPLPVLFPLCIGDDVCISTTSAARGDFRVLRTPSNLLMRLITGVGGWEMSAKYHRGACDGEKNIKVLVALSPTYLPTYIHTYIAT